MLLVLNTQLAVLRLPQLLAHDLLYHPNPLSIRRGRVVQVASTHWQARDRDRTIQM